MSDDALLIKLQDGVLTLTINRPAQRNALNLALLDTLGAQLLAHRDTDDLRCAVITAAGDKCFAAGGDLKELDPLRSEAEARAMSQRVRRALNCVREFPLPVIGALNGLALGGGAELAMACDLRIAAAHAEIGFLQAQLNLTTAWGGGIDLLAAVGPGRGLELLLSARRIGAEEAAQLGLFNRVAPSGQSLETCLDEFLQVYKQRSPRVLRGFKAMALGQRRSLHEALADTEEAHFVDSWVHSDHWDAVAAAQSQRQKKKQQS